MLELMILGASKQSMTQDHMYASLCIVVGTCMNKKLFSMSILIPLPLFIFYPCMLRCFVWPF